MPVRANVFAMVRVLTRGRAVGVRPGPAATHPLNHLPKLRGKEGEAAGVRSGGGVVPEWAPTSEYRHDQCVDRSEYVM